MEVHDIQIVRLQPPERARNAVPYPVSRVIERVPVDAPAFREDEVVGPLEFREDRVGRDERRMQCGSEDFFGGAVVGRRVEGADAFLERGADDGGWAEGVGVRVKLVVECCCAEDEGWEDVA